MEAKFSSLVTVLRRLESLPDYVRLLLVEVHIIANVKYGDNITTMTRQLRLQDPFWKKSSAGE